MSNGFGMGVVPAAVGMALQQAPASDFHQDPLPLRSDPPRIHVPREVDPNVEHSNTATMLALGEAMSRAEGARRGEYQQPKSPLALFQMKRAGLSDTEIAILLRSTGEPLPPPPAAQDGSVVVPPNTQINPNSGIQGTNPIADFLTLGKRTDPFPYYDETYKGSVAKMASARTPVSAPDVLRRAGLRPAGGR